MSRAQYGLGRARGRAESDSYWSDVMNYKEARHRQEMNDANVRSIIAGGLGTVVGMVVQWVVVNYGPVAYRWVKKEVKQAYKEWDEKETRLHEQLKKDWKKGGWDAAFGVVDYLLRMEK